MIQHNPDDPRYKWYDSKVKRLALHANKTDDLIKLVVELLVDKRPEEALELASKHTKQQVYKG